MRIGNDERAARVSVFYATCLIGQFFAVLFIIACGSIALLRQGRITDAGPSHTKDQLVERFKERGRPLPPSLMEMPAHGEGVDEWTN
ncbi:hypothetical protein JQ600_09610 [Bradyrhizobium sp. AUGA SZCCT0176]|uniref:hypothetical protein n=1 Tax=Bradyrhizobium sp. AUGA SZCCT0176 TaxID=2807664 RepID=UPI001BA5730A|nr:hypothetical protein [Bradyrhizobium sp. AUGA SZCCT0176]MBR1225173.1 hypothetical protein [Bradyrhizobium sp. AUGA SZCCT0176]